MVGVKGIEEKSSIIAGVCGGVWDMNMVFRQARCTPFSSALPEPSSHLSLGMGSYRPLGCLTPHLLGERTENKSA